MFLLGTTEPLNTQGSFLTGHLARLSVFNRLPNLILRRSIDPTTGSPPLPETNVRGQRAGDSITEGVCPSLFESGGVIAFADPVSWTWGKSRCTEGNGFGTVLGVDLPKSAV